MCVDATIIGTFGLWLKINKIFIEGRQVAPFLVVLPLPFFSLRSCKRADVVKMQNYRRVNQGSAVVKATHQTQTVFPVFAPAFLLEHKDKGVGGWGGGDSCLLEPKTSAWRPNRSTSETRQLRTSFFIDPLVLRPPPRHTHKHLLLSCFLLIAPPPVVLHTISPLSPSLSVTRSIIPTCFIYQPSSLYYASQRQHTGPTPTPTRGTVAVCSPQPLCREKLKTQLPLTGLPERRPDASQLQNTGAET